MLPSANAPHAAMSARPRAEGMANSSGDIPAIVAAVGNAWVTSSTGFANGAPCAATSRVASVRAPATLTC